MPSLVVALSMSGTGHAGPFDPPSPEVYARPEDQQRARLRDTPCTEADVGHGCHRYEDRLWRDIPCAYDIRPGVIGFRPTDQCYKMEAPRHYRGVWIDAFEGQQFIPDGVTIPAWPETDPGTPEWREQADRAQAARIWLNVDHTDLGKRSTGEGKKVHVEFIGRKTQYTGAYGHMGMFGNAIIVDQLLSAEELK